MIPPLPEDSLSEADADAIYTALFEQMVTGHGQMALTFLGKLPNPHTGQPDEPELPAAKIFIDQLEMLRVKTRGNLGPAETKLLDDTLEVLHSAFAEVLDAVNREP